MPDHTRPSLNTNALELIARLRGLQLQYAEAGRVRESARYAMRADRVRRQIDRPSRAGDACGHPSSLLRV